MSNIEFGLWKTIMRMPTIVVCGVVGICLWGGSSLLAQAPAPTGGQGVGPARRPATTGGTNRALRGNSGPSRLSPSFGGSSVASGIGLSGGRGTTYRQPRRNSTPVLSPYLNMDPTFASSFEGQYLTKILPQQDFNRTQQQTQRAFDSVQGEIGQQQMDLQSGLSTTGHTTSFMNLGRYYSAH